MFVADVACLFIYAIALAANFCTHAQNDLKVNSKKKGQLGK